MGRLTPLQIRNLKEPWRYNDGDGLFLEPTGPTKGNWQLRATVNGRRRDIDLGSPGLVSLKEARDAAFELRAISSAGSIRLPSVNGEGLRS